MMGWIMNALGLGGLLQAFGEHFPCRLPSGGSVLRLFSIKLDLR